MTLHPATLSLLLALCGCGTADLFAEIPEAPGTAAAPWPRLADTPTPPPPGVHTAALPDPLTGTAVAADLGIATRVAAGRAAAVRGPVTGGLAPRAPRSAPAPAVDRGELAARSAAARARAERINAPVLSEAERERLREGVR